jgi:Holliday junction resolvase RusA-like endonuclease
MGDLTGMFPCVTFRIMTTKTANRRALKAHPAPAAQAAGPITFITIPAPPSTNALFFNVKGRGRAKSVAYKAWIDEAGWKLKAQSPAAVPGRVVVVIGIERDNSLSDIDNRSKALLDLLVAHKIIKDDRYVTALAMAWAAKADGLARIAVLPAHDLTLNLITAADGGSGGWFIKPPNEQEPANYGD